MQHIAWAVLRCVKIALAPGIRNKTRAPVLVRVTSGIKDIINAVGEDGLKVYSDGTHTADYGGYLFSLCIAKGIKDNKLELAKYLSDDLINIDTKNPTPRFSDFKVPVEKRR